MCYSSNTSKGEVASTTFPQNPRVCKSSGDSWCCLISEECGAGMVEMGGICICVKISKLSLHSEPYAMFWASCRISGPACKSQASPLAVEAWNRCPSRHSCFGKVRWCFSGTSLSQMQTAEHQSWHFRLTEFERSSIIFKWTLSLLITFIGVQSVCVVIKVANMSHFKGPEVESLFLGFLNCQMGCV